MIKDVSIHGGCGLNHAPGICCFNGGVHSNRHREPSSALDQEEQEGNSRLEFKLRIDLGIPDLKAEFIRDVISLANSEGERPRSNGHLVIGFKNSRREDVRDRHYDGATFGQILDSYICPPLDVVYEEYGDKAEPRVGVLIVRSNSDHLYVVNKRLYDAKGQELLVPGQCWGRKSDRKVELTGEAIHARLLDILECHVEKATLPLKQRIAKLESANGPALHVKQIRFEMAANRDAKVLESLLDKLIPYAQEFDHMVKHEVLDAVMVVSGMAQISLPIALARSVDTVLGALTPVSSGGMWRPARKEIPEEDRQLLRRIGHITFELGWAACRYLRNLELVELIARRYWMLIRYATLNGLEQLQSECLRDARECQRICMEDRTGKTFPEAEKELGDTIADALDAFECEGYRVKTVSPRELEPSDFAAFLAIIKTGDAVNWKSAKDELPHATVLAVALKGEQIVGIGAIKRERRKYTTDVAKKSGVKFPPETSELGYVAVTPEHRGHHLSHCIVKALLKQYTGRLFATTYNPHMKETLKRSGFVKKGEEWKGRKGMLSFWDNE